MMMIRDHGYLPLIIIVSESERLVMNSTNRNDG